MVAATPQDLALNRLLAVLTDADRQRLTQHAFVFDLGRGDTLQQAGEEVVHTWFPCGAALACFFVTTEVGDAIEVAIVGREGAVGGIVSNGNVPAFATAQVRTGGRFVRIKTAALELAKLDSLHLRHWFARYSDCLLAQVFQTAACNARHPISQRASKWLLAAAERTEGMEFAMTQEEMASLLGVGRSFVNKTLGHLRREGIIETRRGRIIIRDEAALRANACDCAVAIENHFDRVLHGIYQ
jgi:CRP-like cAMP-binding protein